MKAFEVNFDGLVGPTHNYAGLSYGNLASAKNRGKPSNPKMAALQGLEKMKMLADLGVRQAVLPPHERPDVLALNDLGFSGSDARVLETSHKQAPFLLAACASASAMWAANAATVSPSSDTGDGHVHFSPANLVWQFHRSLESRTTARVLRRIFSDESYFVHHPPLPATPALADEGAANHMRLCASHGRPGLEIFVYGRQGLDFAGSVTKKFPARQTYEASAAIARRHELGEACVFIRQNPAAIDAGAFHNDVVAVANENVLLYHAKAWPEGIDEIRKKSHALGIDLVPIEVGQRQVPLADAIKSYLFNSQLVSLPDGSMILIAPEECRRIPSTRRFLEGLAGLDHSIRGVKFVDVRQSMRNGGGPACLRLRVVLNEQELAAAHQGVFLTTALYESLKTWIHRHYRERLTPGDLADPKLLEEGRRALDELSQILKLDSIYEFQQR
ncbi:MAG TPA: N-succinylarginine dihydrolase [Tepidisphaeraceae bacterium]|nr:N-succinylarginine dihydrolase [Tepidisphaeraceae bacterium]